MGVWKKGKGKLRDLIYLITLFLPFFSGFEL
jgi:hypothetical protein